MMKNIRIADLFELVDGEYELHGDPNRSFSDVRPVGMESDSSLVWISPSENENERVVKKILELLYRLNGRGRGALA